MTQSSHEIVRGLKAFTKFFQTERSRFAAAPILLISSHADFLKPGLASPQISDAISRVHFLLQQQLGFRTVLANPALHYSFPTVTDVSVLVDLAARVGASTVAAVGSGVAIDLAKAVCCQASNLALDELVLIPSSYGAAMAATSSHALLLDLDEDALIVQPQPSHQQSTATQQPQRHHLPTIVTLEPNLFRTASREESLLAAVALALDHIYQKGTTTSNGNVESLLERAVQCLIQQKNSQESVEEHNVVVDIMYATGASISYGLEGSSDENRSIPLALAASLIPNTFPKYSMTTFLASLVPAYCHELLERPPQGPCVLDLVRRISSFSAPHVVTNESFSSLISHIYANQALWNCRDCSSADFRAILRNHLLV